jgi:hypothetical protein
MKNKMEDLTTSLYTTFPFVLDQRTGNNRRTCRQRLSVYSYMLAECLILSKESPFLKDMLTEQINNILDDCTVFEGMTQSQKLDCLSELSNYACIYALDEKNRKIYERICFLIGDLMSSSRHE